MWRPTAHYPVTIVLPGGRNACFCSRLKIVEGSGWSCYQYYVLIVAVYCCSSKGGVFQPCCTDSASSELLLQHHRFIITLICHKRGKQSLKRAPAVTACHCLPKEECTCGGSKRNCAMYLLRAKVCMCICTQGRSSTLQTAAHIDSFVDQSAPARNAHRTSSKTATDPAMLQH